MRYVSVARYFEKIDRLLRFFGSDLSGFLQFEDSLLSRLLHFVVPFDHLVLEIDDLGYSFDSGFSHERDHLRVVNVCSVRRNDALQRLRASSELSVYL